MSKKGITGIGQSVPTRATGVKYGVHYGIIPLGEIKQHGRGMPAARWGKLSVRSASTQQIPDGN
jgi:hypothetical protein